MPNYFWIEICERDFLSFFLDTLKDAEDIVKKAR